MDLLFLIWYVIVFVYILILSSIKSTLLGKHNALFNIIIMLALALVNVFMYLIMFNLAFYFNAIVIPYVVFIVLFIRKCIEYKKTSFEMHSVDNPKFFQINGIVCAISICMLIAACIV